MAKRSKRPWIVDQAIDGLTKAFTSPTVKTSYASCEIFSTSPMVCPLCQVKIPANTPHSCSKKERS